MIQLNIDMPETCADCPCNDDYYRCGATGNEFDFPSFNDRRMDDCPLIEVKPQWIPCSERLPDKYGMYLVTMTEKAKAEDFGFDVDEIEVNKMRYNSNGWNLPRHIPAWINNVITDEVLAWMPLPEPYREEGDQDED